jgi:hypothetical protein
MKKIEHTHTHTHTHTQNRHNMGKQEVNNKF